jgi:hypothetical protein
VGRPGGGRWREFGPLWTTERGQRCSRRSEPGAHIDGLDDPAQAQEPAIGEDFGGAQRAGDGLGELPVTARSCPQVRPERNSQPQLHQRHAVVHGGDHAQPVDVGRGELRCGEPAGPCARGSFARFLHNGLAARFLTWQRLRRLGTTTCPARSKHQGSAGSVGELPRGTFEPPR